MKIEYICIYVKLLLTLCRIFFFFLEEGKEKGNGGSLFRSLERKRAEKDNRIEYFNDIIREIVEMLRNVQKEWYESNFKKRKIDSWFCSITLIEYFYCKSKNEILIFTMKIFEFFSSYFRNKLIVVLISLKISQISQISYFVKKTKKY